MFCTVQTGGRMAGKILLGIKRKYVLDLLVQRTLK